MGIPCFLGGMARGLLGRNNAIQFRHCRKEGLREADVVLLLGENLAVAASRPRVVRVDRCRNRV